MRMRTLAGRCPIISLKIISVLPGQLLLGAAVAGFLISGCGGGSAGKVNLNNTELAVLGDGGLTGSAAVQVNNAMETLVLKCMQSKGLTYFPNLTTVADQTRSGPAVTGVPQAYITLTERETDGYGFYSKAVRTPGSGQSRGNDSSAEDQYVASLSPADQKPYLVALNGPDSSRVSVTLPGGTAETSPSGGCEGAGEGKIYGSVTNYVLGITGASMLTNLLSNAVSADPTFSAVISKWSSCMKEAGYKYVSPEDLWNKLAAKIGNSPAPVTHTLEISTAVADYRCSSAVKLEPTIDKLQNQHAAQLSNTLLQNLASITQIEDTALRNAKSVQASN